MAGRGGIADADRPLSRRTACHTSVNHGLLNVQTAPDCASQDSERPKKSKDWMGNNALKSAMLTNDDDLFAGSHARRSSGAFKALEEATVSKNSLHPVADFLCKDLETYLPNNMDKEIFVDAIAKDGLVA